MYIHRFPELCVRLTRSFLDAPESINGAPYDAWFIKVKEVSEKEELLSPSEYEAFVASEQ